MGRKPLSLMMGGLLALNMAMAPSYAKGLDLLHSVPLEISGYAEAKTLPEKFTSSEQVLKILNQTGNLLVHMEVLRRGYFDLPAPEQEKLVTGVHARYLSSENDVSKFFDNGYTQLVYKNNKSGLFFLRKANDKLSNQFTSLAYAMGQADVDVNIENASPDVMTFRKLDVTYKLTDAVGLDAKSHQPGFWPSFNRVMKAIDGVGPFTSFAKNDFSSTYVPFASDLTLANAGKIQISQAESTAVKPDGGPEKPVGGLTCQPAINSGGELTVDLGKAFRSTAIRLGATADGSEKAYFFNTGETNQFRVLVVNKSNTLLADFLSPIAPYIIEDIDGDGVDELVVRQFLLNQDDPVKVYRYAPSCGYQLDKVVSNYFR